MPNEPQIDPRLYSRRDVLAMGAALCAAAALPGHAQTPAPKPILARTIPRTGEMLPVVGLGTQFVLDIGGDQEKRASRIAVIRALLDNGGKVIDTAPSYGPAEATLGDLLAEMKVRHQAFIATKFSDRGRDAANAELKESQRRIRTEKIDLMLRHNIGFVERSQAADHFAAMRDWKQAGICRYIGVTHS